MRVTKNVWNIKTVFNFPTLYALTNITDLCCGRDGKCIAM